MKRLGFKNGFETKPFFIEDAILASPKIQNPKSKIPNS
jgi:hypothetical protein